MTFLELGDGARHEKMIKQSRSLSFSRTTLDRCKIHPKNFNTSYCLDCKMYSCSACIGIAHANHIHKIVSAAARECAEKLAQRISPIREAREGLCDAMKHIERTKDTVLGQQVKMTADVDTTFNALAKILERRKAELKAKINGLTQRKVGKLSSQYLEFKRLAGELDRMAKFTEEAIHSSTDRELLTLYSFLHQTTDKRLDAAVTKDLQPTEAANISLKSSVKEDMLSNLCRRNLYVFLKQAEPGNCSAEGAGLTSAQTMHCSQFTVNVVDKNHRPCSSIQDVTVKVNACQDEAEETTTLVKEKGNGHYLVSFCPKFRGKCEVHVCVNKEAIPGSPFSLRVDMPKAHLGIPQGCIHDVNFPRGIVLGPNEKILICEWNGTKIVEMDKIGRRSHTISCDAISHPASFAQTHSGNIFVVDGAGQKCGVKKLDEAGAVLASVTGEGSELGEFNTPRGVKVSSENEVFVCDRDNSRIQVFDVNLNYRRCIDLSQMSFDTKPKPNDIAFDTASNIYISDYANNCIHQLGQNEDYLSSLAIGQLAGPECIAIDGSDHICPRVTE
jgi:tripartite motif-containing protein 2/3